jgi:hypothetical protein
MKGIVQIKGNSSYLWGQQFVDLEAVAVIFQVESGDYQKRRVLLMPTLRLNNLVFLFLVLASPLHSLLCLMMV